MSGDESLEEAWTRVEESWGDDDAHRRFIALCGVLDRLDEAGARYRVVREREPERAAEAGRRIDQIVARALVTLQSNRTEAPKGPPRWLLGLAVAITLALIGATMWVISRL